MTPTTEHDRDLLLRLLNRLGSRYLNDRGWWTGDVRSAWACLKDDLWLAFDRTDYGQHFESVMSDLRLDEFISGQPDDRTRRSFRHRTTRQLTAHWVVLTRIVNVWHCNTFDHDWEVIACNGENGTEDLECTRCGIHHHVQY